MTRRRGSEGFTLLEIVCVLAIVALLAAVVLPAIPLKTSRPKLEALAVATAALLKADRNAAMRRGVPVATELSLATRTIRSRANGQQVRVPSDVGFDAVLATLCAGRAAGPTIDFFPSGMSCGGTIIMNALGTRLEIRVSWLTGSVEIVPAAAT
jgi:general secretion pathway protein H